MLPGYRRRSAWSSRTCLSKEAGLQVEVYQNIKEAKYIFHKVEER